MKTFYKIFLGLSAICAVTAIAMFAMSNPMGAGPFATMTFIALAIGLKGHPIMKGYSFTIWILSAVVASMFYPQYFTIIGGFNTKNLIIPLMQIIMFGMGTTISLQDFINVARMPKAVISGVIAQFTIMPLVGFTLAMILQKYFGTPPEIAAGVVLIGCSPCGLASDVMNFIAGNNLALSITLTSTATFLAPFVTPLLMKVFAGTMVDIDTIGMMLTIVKIIVLPVILGQIYRKFLHGKMEWLDKLLPKLSMFGIAIIITVITAAGRDSLLKVGLLLIVAAIIHNGLGYFFGYWMSRIVFRLDKRSCRTIAIEVGLQNGGLASGIALEMGKLQTMGLFSAVFGPTMNITGSTVANWWRVHPVEPNERGDFKVQETEHK